MDVEEGDEDLGSDLFDDYVGQVIQTAGLALKACAAPPTPEAIAWSSSSDEEGDDMGFGLFDDDIPSSTSFKKEIESAQETKKYPEQMAELTDDIFSLDSKEEDLPTKGKIFQENLFYLGKINIDQNLF